jgi:sugar phosphate isomerase/epimerase
MIALATDYNGESRNTGAIKKTLERIARAGIGHIHWCHEWTGSYLYSRYEMTQIKDWLDEWGLKTRGVHASSGEGRNHYRTAEEFVNERSDLKDYVSANENNRRAGVELVQNRIDLARELDAGEIALHLHLPFRIFEHDSDFKQRFYTQAFKSFDDLRPYAEKNGIRICIENLSDSPESCQIEMFDRLFDRYSADFLGLCFDTGHGNITGGGDGLAIVRRFRDRFFIPHIHDNHGTADSHQIPMTGTFNWEGFAEIIIRSPCKTPYLFELNMRGEEDLFFKQVLEADEQFHALIRRK